MLDSKVLEPATSRSIRLDEQPIAFMTPAAYIYVVYPRRIVTYDQTVLTEEIVLTEEVKHISYSGFFVFILYCSDRLQRRNLLKWEECVDFGLIDGDVKSIKAHDQNRLVINLATYFKVVDVNQQSRVNSIRFDQELDIEQVCCEFENQGRVVNICYVLQKSNRIMKYSIHQIGTVLDSELELQTGKIIFITILKFDKVTVLSSYLPQLLLTINDSLQLCLFDLFDSNTSPKLTFDIRHLMNPEQVLTLLQVNYNCQTRVIHLKIGKDMCSAKIHNKLHPGKISVSDLIQDVKLKKDVQGRLVASNAQYIVILRDLILDLKRVQSPVSQQMLEIMRQKAKIAEEILKYSAQQKLELVESLEVKNETEEDIPEALDHYEYEALTEQTDNLPQTVLQSQEPSLTIETDNKFEATIPAFVEMGIQTMPFESTMVNINYNEIEQEVLSLVSKYMEDTQSELQSYYRRVQAKVQSHKDMMTTVVTSTLKDTTNNEIKNYLSEFFVPKLEKYVTLTFNKLNQINSITCARNSQQIASEQVKYSEFNKHIIDKNRQFMKKLLDGVKQSVKVFDDKKHDMIVNFEAKLNLLNDLIVQAEEMVKTFESKSKEESLDSFQNRIYSLVDGIDHGIAKLQKTEEQIPLPPILQTGASQQSQTSRIYSQNQNYNNPQVLYMQNNRSFQLASQPPTNYIPWQGPSSQYVPGSPQFVYTQQPIHQTHPPTQIVYPTAPPNSYTIPTFQPSQQHNPQLQFMPGQMAAHNSVPLQPTPNYF